MLRILKFGLASRNWPYLLAGGVGMPTVFLSF
jgi:hypothetical protein